MAQLDLYLLGHRPQGQDVVIPARSRNVSDLAVSFTEDLARFMFDLAEQYIHCEPGDEILLLRGQLDCRGIMARPDFNDHFRLRVQSGQHFELQQILQRREALCTRSHQFMHRRRTDLFQPRPILPPSHPQLGCMR